MLLIILKCKNLKITEITEILLGIKNFYKNVYQIFYK